MRIFALLLGLCATPAAAQDVTLTLTPQEVLAIVKSMDGWPIIKAPPQGFFAVQVKIGRALDRNPDARNAVKESEHSR